MALMVDEILTGATNLAGTDDLFTPRCSAIVANKINIEWHQWKDNTDKPYALSNATMISRYDDNPLRAAMIVFLMMQDSANVQDNTA